MDFPFNELAVMVLQIGIGDDQFEMIAEWNPMGDRYDKMGNPKSWKGWKFRARYLEPAQ